MKDYLFFPDVTSQFPNRRDSFILFSYLKYHISYLEIAKTAFVGQFLM